MTTLERLGQWSGLNPDARRSIYNAPSAAAARRQPQRSTVLRSEPVNLTSSLKAEITKFGNDGFPVLCDVVHTDPGRELLDPPLPWRGHLRLLYALDPNPGPDGVCHHVLLLVRGEVRTCHEAAASTFGIGTGDYAPTREV